MINHKSKKGFTLIELLVVIAIIAILSVVVILTLNPAELLRQARDSNRVSDFATLKSAISLFEADVTTSSVSALGTWGTLYISSASTGMSTTTNFDLQTGPGWGWTTAAGQVLTASTSRNINGTGWIPVNFSLISSGAPIGNEPVDPSNTGSSTYTYAASSTVFKMAVKTESSKYSTAGGGDIETSDGGNSTGTYEQGTNLAL